MLFRSREDFAVGIRTLSGILAEESMSAREHLDERANDYLLAKEISDSKGVPMEWLLNPAKVQPQTEIVTAPAP